MIRPLYMLGFQAVAWTGFSVCPPRLQEVHTERPCLVYSFAALRRRGPASRAKRALRLKFILRT
jgi:hypothetical protein